MSEPIFMPNFFITLLAWCFYIQPNILSFNGLLEELDQALLLPPFDDQEEEPSPTPLSQLGGEIPYIVYYF